MNAINVDKHTAYSESQITECSEIYFKRYQYKNKRRYYIHWIFPAMSGTRQTNYISKKKILFQYTGEDKK